MIKRTLLIVLLLGLAGWTGCYAPHRPAFGPIIMAPIPYDGVYVMVDLAAFSC